MYIKERISDGYLDRYKMYPEEFREDAEVFFSELVKERYRDNKLRFDHMEFLLSENT